jgi:hypothetical protein
MSEQLQIILWFGTCSIISIVLTLLFLLSSDDEFEKGTAWIWLLCSFTPIPGCIVPIVLFFIIGWFILIKLPTILFPS